MPSFERADRNKDDTWNDGAVRKLVRCEALVKLLDKIQPLEDVDAISSLVAKEWKFLANVASWRLVVVDEEGFLVIDGYRGEAHASQAAEICSWDRFHLDSRLPLLVDASAPVDNPPPYHLVGNAVSEISVMPILREGVCIAVLSVAGRNEPFGELDSRYIRILGAHFADRIFDILHRRRHLEDLKTKASKDALTGILNRGAIVERLGTLFRVSKRTSDPLSIILLDVDRFKDVNDRYGHLTGDRVLTEIAQRLVRQFREADHLGRYGGEEFLSVLHPCDGEAVSVAAERVRESIAAKPFLIEGGGELKVTISIGTATMTEDDGTIEFLLKRADDALYRSKNEGRDRVTPG